MSGIDTGSNPSELSCNSVNYWMELLIPDTAKVLASYDHPHWGSYAAITENRFGEGSAFYLGCYFEAALLKGLLTYIVKSTDILLPTEQYPIIFKRGINDYDKKITYCFNYSDASSEITWRDGDATLLMQDRTVKDGDTLTIQGWDFVVAEQV